MRVCYAVFIRWFCLVGLGLRLVAHATPSHAQTVLATGQIVFTGVT